MMIKSNAEMVKTLIHEFFAQNQNDQTLRNNMQRETLNYIASTMRIQSVTGANRNANQAAGAGAPAGTQPTGTPPLRNPGGNAP